MAWGGEFQPPPFCMKPCMYMYKEFPYLRNKLSRTLCRRRFCCLFGSSSGKKTREKRREKRRGEERRGEERRGEERRGEERRGEERRGEERRGEEKGKSGRGGKKWSTTLKFLSSAKISV